jgi:hypothetical protein
MAHVIEIRFPGESFRELMLRVRGWLNSENAWPSTFRSGKRFPKPRREVPRCHIVIPFDALLGRYSAIDR